MTVRKIVRKIHLWIGLGSGAIVFILGITGCILVFVDEVKPLVYPQRLFVSSAAGQPQSLTTLLHTAEDAWGEAKPVTAMEIYNDPTRTVHFRAYRANDQEGTWYWDAKQYYESVFVDPYTGGVVATENSEFEFFRVVLFLHWSLLFSNAIGQPIVGVATLLFALSLMTGLVLWWPKNRKARRTRFRFRWKASTGAKRKNYDLHNILGFYSISLAFIIALTGLVWAFPWVNDGVQWLANVGTKSESLVIAPLPDNPVEEEAGVIDKVYAAVRARYPDATGYHVYFGQSDDAPINVLIRYQGTWRDVIEQYSAYSGNWLNTVKFSDKNRGEKLRSMNYDIHVGSILGMPGKILAFLASLIAASLPVTGFIIWYNRGSRHKTIAVGKSNSKP